MHSPTHQSNAPGTPAPVRVLIADADQLFAQSLAMALWWWPDLEPIAEFPVSGPQAVEAIADLEPDVALVDYWIPLMSGAAVSAIVAKRETKTRVIITAGRHGASEINQCLEAGAVGFLPKNSSVEQIVKSILRANTGELPIDAPRLEALRDSLEARERTEKEVLAQIARLTRRELELLTLQNRGFSTLEIAAELSIAPSTVRDHFHNIVVKTGAKSKERAAAMARLAGAITT